RGLSFDPEEMAPYCGGGYEVRLSLSRIIDEKTGKKLHLKQPCIALEGGVCNAEYASCRLNCPPAYPPYWRGTWLERTDPHPQATPPDRPSDGAERSGEQ